MLYLHVIHYVGFFGAQIFNAILIYLIVKRANKLFGSYRRVLLFFSLCTVLLSWVEIFTQPIFHIKGPMFVVFLDRHVVSESVGEFLARLHCGTFGFLISVLAAQFFYRYVALCRPNLLSFLRGPWIFSIFAPCILNYILCFNLVRWGMAATAEKRAYLKQDLKLVYNSDSDVISFIGPLYWTVGKQGEKLWKWKDVSSTVAFSSLIIFFAVKIGCHMKTAKVHMSARTLELNRQLFIMLTLQTLAPFGLLYVPVFFFMFLPMIGLSLGPYVNYPSAGFATYPMFESLIAIYCIADFRNTIFKVLCGCRHVQNGSVSTARRSQGSALKSFH